MTGLWVEHQLEADTRRSRWGKYLHLSGLMCSMRAWGTGTTPGNSTQGAPQPSLCRERAPGSVCLAKNEGETWASPEPRGLSFLLSQFIRPTLGGEHCWASSLLWEAAPADS